MRERGSIGITSIAPLVLALVSLIALYIATREITSLLLFPVILFFVYRSDPWVRYLASLFLGESILIIRAEFSLYLLSMALVSLSTANFLLKPGEKIFSRISAPILIQAPIYVLVPEVIPLATTPLIILLVLVVKEYLRLSRSRVYVSQESSVVYLGDRFYVTINLISPGVVRYIVYLDDRRIIEDMGENEIFIRIPIEASYLGTLRSSIRISIRDPRDLVSIDYGPYILETRVIARLYEDLRISRSVIAKYIDYLSTPMIYETSLREEVSRGFREERFVWRLSLELMSRLEALRESLFGELIGLREYIPGDNPKSIYWKKSLRFEDRESLAAKIFGEERLERGVGDGVVVLADLLATNPVELDLMLHTIYSTLLLYSKSESDASRRALIYIRAPKEKIYLIRGKVIDVLLGLNMFVIEKGIQALYNYQSWSRSSPPIKGSVKGLLGDLVAYYRGFARALIRDLEEKRVSKKSRVSVVFSRAQSLKYYIVINELRSSGLNVSVPVTEVVSQGV